MDKIEQSGALDENGVPKHWIRTEYLGIGRAAVQNVLMDT